MARTYPYKHAGSAILCGTAPSLFEDLEEARRLRPDAPILGVTTMARLVPEVEHIWTQHGDEAGRLRDMAKRKIYVHARAKNYKGVPANVEECDFLWPELNWVGGSSGFAGAMWASHGLGFTEVIMCGIPISVDELGYVESLPLTPERFAIGHNYGSTVGWQRQILGFKERGLTKAVRSMSGWTKEVFGAPLEGRMAGEAA